MYRSKAHKITTIKGNKNILCGKDILENVEWVETNSFCLGEMIQKNYVNDGE